MLDADDVLYAVILECEERGIVETDDGDVVVSRTVEFFFSCANWSKYIEVLLNGVSSYRCIDVDVYGPYAEIILHEVR